MITREHIAEEIKKVEEGPMTWESLERFGSLHKAKKYLCKEHHEKEEFTPEVAKKWVRSMYPGGEHWTMEQTSALLKQRGYHHKPEEWYAIMNSLYSDYVATMVKYNADRPEIWADLAHDWLDDKDAVDNKVEEYYERVVKHY